jgi:hypothetical protein
VEKVVNRLWLLFLVAFLGSTVVGCGGLSEKEKNKNKDLDRPRSTASEK